MRTVIQNGKLITPHRVIDGGSIIIQDGLILGLVESGDVSVSSDDYCIDAQGYYVSPGFIDMHVHGGGGYDVMDGSVDSICGMCQAHAAFGTTAIIPTTLAADWDDILLAIDAIRAAKNNSIGAKILGVHLEGPYFSQAERGAQSASHLRTPNPSEYIKVLDYWDGIVIMALAPELDGALELGRELRKRGILASIAHSNANYDEIVRAVENGFTNITHFYSGCSIVHRKNAYRYAGVVESGYLINELTVQVIADGKHLPSSLLQLIYKLKGSDKIALITDGLSFSAADVKENTLYTQKTGVQVILEDDVMKLPDRCSFAGSIATTNSLVRNMIKLANAPLTEAVKMASLTPARILNISHKTGSLSVGLAADIVLFDEDINVSLTMVDGKIVFKK
ncbi:N-acetylglucosamine-6-phosphate deacetylase [Anaerosporomusa subterranea]|uniref:N-acetylglucosamine-6-phosphate deacetylase n=1 Tax=Anaerosporomusa subterranea TaxID=1794912 RepID=A0A154BRI4_ANASB|nr:N-acetylglucosamine-6-phosphate deacetylase [Anaerosporomusa subterranea]KYZ76541.1 N-acetylglucosamine-6-phosphate deacetylase [Anaerosporomusa subterranea]